MSHFIKTFFLIIVSFAFTAKLSLADSGIFDRHVVIQTATMNYYSGAAFDTTHLGVFTSSHTLWLKGGQVKTFKNGPDDITGAAMFYRVYENGASILPSFDTLYLPWKEDVQSPFGSIDQTWELATHNLNLLHGLTDGDYVIEIYFEAYYTVNAVHDIHTDNNAGANYKSAFTINNCQLVLPDNMKFCSPFNVNIQANQGHNAYLWSTGATTPAINVNQPGTYTVTVTNTTCTTTDSVVITMDTSAFTLFIGNDTVVCGAGLVHLDAGQGFNQYQWSTGAQTQEIFVNSTAQYAVTVTTPDGCLLMDERLVTFRGLPLIDIGSVEIICAGDSLIIDAGTGFTSYLWQDSSQTQSISVFDAGLYMVTVTDSFGCSAFDVLQVIVRQAVIADFSYNNIDNPQIHFIDLSEHHTFCKWDFLGNGTYTELPAGNTSYLYLTPGTYNVSLIAYNECFADTTGMDVEVVLGPGIDENDINSLLIYPNPVAEKLFITSNRFINQINVYDSKGRKVKNMILESASINDIIEVNVSNFCNGIYFIESISNEEITRNTFIISK